MRRVGPGRRRRSGAEAPPRLVGSVLGDLEGPVAVIDERGRIDVGAGDWWLEWGVGAEDRWRVAHEEVAVRQHRVEDAPVFATWMRVPGGDVVQRAGVVNDGSGRALLLEFENASPTAVVVAVAVRVWRACSLSADVDQLSFGGIERLRGERPAGAVVACAGDPWPDVTAGPDAARCEVSDDRGGAGALLVALPHRQRVRFLASIEGPMPTRWPTPDEVARGWRAVTAEALSVEVPDAALGEAWRRILPDLVVQAGSADPTLAAEAAPPLDIAGLCDEADRARVTVVAAAEAGGLRGRSAVAGLRALASREIRAGSPSGLAMLAGPLAAAAGDSLDRTTLEEVARALDVASPAAAGDARQLLAAVTLDRSEPRSAPAVAAARVTDVLVDERDPGSLSLLPEVPPAWRGQSVDVRNLGTAGGLVSFSVRWHGARPALLWARHGGPDGVELRCPGLDPGWSTREREGEALLAEPAP